ncbi:MAG: acetone carboxylase subunit gamma [Pseudomonadota bacterium]
MSAFRFITPHIGIRGNQTICVVCSEALGPSSKPWKELVVRRETPLAEAGGKAWDTGHDGVVLRQFICPSCATLLDTETATSKDPVLVDRLSDDG